MINIEHFICISWESSCQEQARHNTPHGAIRMIGKDLTYGVLCEESKQGNKRKSHHIRRSHCVGLQC